MPSLGCRGVVVALASVAAVVRRLDGVRTRSSTCCPDFAPPQVDDPDRGARLRARAGRACWSRCRSRRRSAASPGSTALRSESIQGLSVDHGGLRRRTRRVPRAPAARRAARRRRRRRLPLGVGAAAPLAAHVGDDGRAEDRPRLATRCRRWSCARFADWTLRPRLLIVPGVARVNVFGGEVRQLQIQVHPARAACARARARRRAGRGARTATAIARRRLHRDREPAHRARDRRRAGRRRDGARRDVVRGTPRRQAACVSATSPTVVEGARPALRRRARAGRARRAADAARASTAPIRWR